MKTFNFLLLQFCLLLFAAMVPAQTAKTNAAQPNAEQAGKTVKLPQVREELLKRLKASRELRMELVKNNNSAGVSQLVKSDQENTLWVKSAIEKYGWLGNSLVGEDGEDAAFKLVMYAIQDREFQKQYFELLQTAVKDGEAPASQLPLLAERMNLMAGNAMTLPPGASIKSTNGASTQIINSQAVSSVKYPDLREELLKRMAADQQVRVEQTNKYKGVPLLLSAQEEMRKIDAENTAWIKPLMKQHGWLGKSLVGVDGATAAFVLVQHTQDAEFRKSSLELLQKAVKEGEARGDQLALLTDRFLISEGKPQRYGTQTRVTKDGKFEVPPIEDEANVDKRRAEVGLGPLAEYIERMRQTYSKPKN
jgi:hypothetical protein